MKKLLLIQLAIILSLMLYQPAMAAVTLDPNLVPDNAPMAEVVKGSSLKGDKSAGSSVAVYVLQKFANILIYLAAPLAVFFIAFAGWSYTVAMGDNKGMEAAKKQLLWAILGLATILISVIAIKWIISAFFDLTA